MKTILFLFVSTFLILGAFAQPGTLDQTFGDQGKVLEESFVGDARAIIVQPDGKILVGGLSDTISENGADFGGFLVARFNSNGTLDLSFGDRGRTLIREVQGVRAMQVNALAVQPDGKIIACGRFIVTSPYGIIGIVRYNANGTIDNTFGNNGVVLTSIARENLIGDMMLQPDGKIIITGQKKANENDNSTSFILRYNTDGSKDESFGQAGLVLTTFSSPINIHAIGIQNDGKIIIGGEYIIYFYQILARYFPDGRIDSSFDGNGIAALTTAIGRMYDLAIQEDGKIVIAGSSAGSMLAARFNNSGSVDSTFGNSKTGYTILPMTSGYSVAKDVFIQPDKSIILTGTYVQEIGSGLGAVKFTQSGIIDSLFGENGVAVSGFPGLGLLPYENPGAIQPDGNIIVCASVWPEYDDDFSRIGMVRFNGVNDRTPKYVRIKKWLHHHGFTWEDWPGKNISYFSVQRSSNGNAFNEIARLFNRNNQPYSYEDAAPLNGSNYYRLAAVSADGSTAYSNMIAIDNNAIKLYPNPVRNTLQVEGLPATEKTKLTITDFMGNIKMSIQVTAKNYNWNVSQLKQGNYILKAESKGITLTKKFVKE